MELGKSTCLTSGYILQSYSHQDSMVLEQPGKPRTKNQFSSVTQSCLAKNTHLNYAW